MTRVVPLYPSFARGEVSPLMYGRSDLEPYRTFLKKCRNATVRPFGVASRIPGTEYIATAKKQCRLLKFVFSAADNYIIECGVGYFRFYENGAVIMSGGSPYEIANPFTSWDQVKSIQYVQLDDIIKIVYKDDVNHSNRPLELVRYASNNWVLRQVSFQCTPFLEENLTSTTLAASAQTGTITVTASSPIFNANHVGSFWKLGGTTTVDDVTRQGFFKITAFTDSTHVTAKVQWKLTNASATDIWSEGAFSDYRGYPSAIALLDGRLYYARTPNSPRAVYGSKPYKYENFTPAINNEQDGAINIELATNSSGDGSDIRWIVGGQFLLAGTCGNEFVIKGEQGPLTPTDVTARARSNWGSEAIQPLCVGSVINFVQRYGGRVRQFTYDYYLDAYKAVDISLFSEHLFASPIVDLAYSKMPDAILWCLLKNGQVATLTLEPDQEVNAWSLQDFGDGTVESIETVPSYDGMYDEVYFVVNRGGTRHIERMNDLKQADIQCFSWYVRSGLVYDAFTKPAGKTITVSGTTLTCSGAYFTPAMVGNRIRRIAKSTYEMLAEAIITGYTDSTHVTVSWVKKSGTTWSAYRWGVAVSSVSGLDHLEGKEVAILADGAVQPKKTVASGGVILDTDAFVVIAGLPYQTVITTMPDENGAQNGTAVGKKKRMHEIAVRVYRTLGGRAGRDLCNLQPIRYRDATDKLGTAPELFTGIIPNIKYNQGWTYEADMTLEQSEPLPMNILAVAPIVNEQDK